MRAALAGHAGWRRCGDRRRLPHRRRVPEQEPAERPEGRRQCVPEMAVAEHVANTKRVETSGTDSPRLAPDRFAEFPDPVLEPQFDAFLTESSRQWPTRTRTSRRSGRRPTASGWTGGRHSQAKGVRVDFLCPDDACRYGEQGLLRRRADPGADRRLPGIQQLGWQTVFAQDEEDFGPDSLLGAYPIVRWC
jgi:hypothetical protein